MDSRVPESLDDLVAQYDRFIYWAIPKFSPCPVSRDEVEDLHQTVYVRIIESDFLTRCRAYYATHEGRFSTSLGVLIRHLLLDYRDSKRRDITLRERYLQDVSWIGPVCFEGRIVAMDRLDKLCRSRRLRGQREASIREVFHAAIAVGDPCAEDIATHLGMNASTVRSHFAQARRVARGVYR